LIKVVPKTTLPFERQQCTPLGSTRTTTTAQCPFTPSAVQNYPAIDKSEWNTLPFELQHTPASTRATTAATIAKCPFTPSAVQNYPAIDEWFSAKSTKRSIASASAGAGIAAGAAEGMNGAGAGAVGVGSASDEDTSADYHEDGQGFARCSFLSIRLSLPPPLATNLCTEELDQLCTVLVPL
jgi:hypothetical protein